MRSIHPSSARIGLIGAGVIALLVTAAAPSQAHAGINLYGATAKSGGYGTAFLRIPHGCEGDDTNAVTVTIPSGIDPAGVKPQQKAGWAITRTANTITWSGGALPDDEFDDFGLNLKWPTLNAGEAQRVVAFPVVQACSAEAKAAKDGSDIVVTASMPDLAGLQVSVFAGDTRLARTTVGKDGALRVAVPAAKAGTTPLTLHRGGRLIATTTAGTAAWTQMAGDGSDMKHPAPTVTVVAAASSGH